MHERQAPRSASLLFVGGLLGCLVSTVLFAVLTGARTGAAGRGVLVLRLGHGLDTKHPVHLAMERMADRVEELSSGRMRLLIAPNGQLGSETECIELVQNGALAMAKTSTAPLEAFLPQMGLFGVPYVFRDAEHYWRVLDGPIGEELLAAGVAKGMVGLCWYDAGARSFYTRATPVARPQDLQGLKIRVQNSRTAIRMVELFGGSPTPLSFSELYTGLQQGLVDGAENNPPSFWSSRHFEVCKEYCLNEHTRVPDLLVVSSTHWDRLDPEQRAWLTQAARESAEWQREAWALRTVQALEAVREAGVTIREPSLDRFRSGAREMHQSYRGTALGDLIHRVEKTP